MCITHDNAFATAHCGRSLMFVTHADPGGGVLLAKFIREWLSGVPGENLEEIVIAPAICKIH